MLEKLLEQVEKPARYIGNEWNAVRKDLGSVDVKFALCFPDLYEIGMSHLGFKLMYHLLNEQEDVACERVFAPWTDFEELLRQNSLPLFSLESKTPIKNFDIIGFSLAYEMSYTNVLNMLELGGIPIFTSQRGEKDPLVIAGGVATSNPEAMSDFFDLFVIGEAEEVALELIDKYKSFRKKVARRKLLEILSEIKGVYVPSLNHAGKKRIEKRIIKDLDKSFYPTKQIVPYIKIIHDRISIEIMRGCPNKCRFCSATRIYHPVRKRSIPKILELAEETQRQTGYEEISLLSLSSGDYPRINELLVSLVSKFKRKGISLSLPSLRIEEALKSIPETLKQMTLKTFTFAPEAGSERLREAIGKNINLNHLYETADKLYKTGLRNIKLYFMIGLPDEKDEDIKDILNIIHKLKGNISVSISPFIPKPHTPFERNSMEKAEMLKDKAIFLKHGVKNRKVKLDYRDPDLSFMEGVLSRGDRSLGRVIYTAYRKGAKFDSWGERFNIEKWLESFNECGIDPGFYVYRKPDSEEILPWSHVGI